MSSLPSPLLAAACVPVVYAALILALIVAGRGQAVRSVAGFIPDCIVLVRRLLGDPRVPRRHKQLLGALIGYLVLPLDLVPDFIPVAGQIDDALVVAVVLRIVLRGSGAALLREHWSGPDELARARAAPRRPDCSQYRSCPSPIMEQPLLIPARRADTGRTRSAPRPRHSAGTMIQTAT